MSGKFVFSLASREQETREWFFMRTPYRGTAKSGKDTISLRR